MCTDLLMLTCGQTFVQQLFIEHPPSARLWYSRNAKIPGILEIKFSVPVLKELNMMGKRQFLCDQFFNSTMNIPSRMLCADPTVLLKILRV